jgi:hypothetical protein
LLCQQSAVPTPSRRCQARVLPQQWLLKRTELAKKEGAPLLARTKTKKDLWGAHSPEVFPVRSWREITLPLTPEHGYWENRLI